MRRFVLLGDPVGHSLSPVMHHAAFDEWGVAATYEAVRATEDALESAMRAASGGNVTLPHKTVAATLLDRPSETVRRVGACNCFWSSAEGLVGDNTDVEGLAAALHEASMPLADTRVLVVGAGGAARAAVLTLLHGGAAAIEVSNRTVERARALAAALADPRVVVLEDGPQGRYDLAVNATRLGLVAEDPLPVDIGRLAVGAVFDLVYGARGTPWTRYARERGIPAADGLGMLVHQAALSLGRWFPDRTPPIETMREAARAELSRRASADAREEA